MKNIAITEELESMKKTNSEKYVKIIDQLKKDKVNIGTEKDTIIQTLSADLDKIKEGIENNYFYDEKKNYLKNRIFYPISPSGYP